MDTCPNRRLQADPEQRVQLITAPDRLCHACVNLRHGGCTLGGPEHETHMRAQDEDVLARLRMYRAAGISTLRLSFNVEGNAAKLDDVARLMDLVHTVNAE